MNHILLKLSNRKTFFIGTFLLLSTGFICNSCLEQRLKETATFFEGTGDIYVQKKKVDVEIVYAPYYYLHGNTSIHSASVETPNGETVELKPYEFLDTYLKAPAKEDFTPSMIPIGLYNFTGSFGDNKETFEISDNFNAHVINFPQIDSVGYDTTNYHIYVFWDAVNDAGIYKVNLLDETGKVVFDGPALTSASNTFVIELNTEGWTTAPYKGDVFTLQLHAFSLDEDASENNWFYNIECDTYSETQVMWGG